jgi:hypothetical protein
VLATTNPHVGLRSERRSVGKKNFLMNIMARLPLFMMPVKKICATLAIRASMF